MSQNFSERVNATPPLSIQIGTMNAALRNSIWNFILKVIDRRSIDTIVSMVSIGDRFFKFPRHQIPSAVVFECTEWLWNAYLALEWHGVYNLLEFVVENSEELSGERVIRKACERSANNLLAREVSGYRFIQGVLSPISDKSEVETINEVMATAKTVGLNGVRVHIETAVRLLGQKPEPDYRNSIKESISAVESAVKGISGVGGGGLDAALGELEKHTEIHPALQKGFRNLYGYSSDEKGIRHALIEEAKIGFDEAKFMLVACSAAANFLIAKANEGGILSK